MSGVMECYVQDSGYIELGATVWPTLKLLKLMPFLEDFLSVPFFQWHSNYSEHVFE